MRVYEENRVKVSICDVCQKNGVIRQVPPDVSPLIRVERKKVRRWDLCDEHFKLLTDMIGDGSFHA